MDMQTQTQITLASELAAQGLRQTKIAAHLGRHRETIGLWLKGIAAEGLAGILARHAQAKKGPRRARQVSRTIKRLIWELRVREHECCRQKIAYFLERERQIRLSVPKIYEILAEKYVIRSKWHKNQHRGMVPTASGPRTVIQMDTVAFGQIFAFTGIDIYTKAEAEVVLRPVLTSEDGAAFLQAAMARRFTGRVAVLQTDGGPEFKGSFAQQARAYCDRHRIARPYKKNEKAYIESFNRTLRKECLGWGTYRVNSIALAVMTLSQAFFSGDCKPCFPPVEPIGLRRYDASHILAGGIMAQITEVAPDLFRITTFLEPFNLQFSQFLVRDDEPLLFHTGPRLLFSDVKDAVAQLIDVRTLRWIGFSHFEADECGSLPDWQRVAPQAEAVCSLVGKLVSVDDCLALRPAKGMADGEVLQTGRFRFQFLTTPHVPHCWESGLMFEETQRTLLCSDLFHQAGDGEPVTQSDVVGRCRDVLVEYQQGPLANYMPYCTLTDPTLTRLAALKPKTLATMHGSVYVGDGAQALRDLATVFREVLGGR